MRLLRGEKDMPPEFVQQIDPSDMTPDQRPTTTGETEVEYDYSKSRDHIEQAKSFQEKLKVSMELNSDKTKD